MKLVEVIILAGTHCISPLQHADGLTDAAKVSCAVIVEKDTDANLVSVMPPWQVNAPEVQMALNAGRTALPGARIASAPALRIEPAAAEPSVVPPPPPPAPSAVPVQEPEDTVQSSANAEVDSTNQPAEAPPEAVTEQPEAADSTAPAETAPRKSQDRPVRLADASEPPQKPARVARAANGQCLGGAKPAWYTNKDGHRKYRCVVPGKTKLY